MENIIENNKIIAEFLEWEFDDLSETFETPFLKLVEPQAFGDEQFSCKLQDFELEFHSDWNWLMKVVEKIESIEDCVYQVDILQEGCKILKRCCLLIDKRVGKLESDTTKIKSVYLACVEFIKWYNKQNKNNDKENNYIRII